jgi:hypothetical protein
VCDFPPKEINTERKRERWNAIKTESRKERKNGEQKE